MELAWGQFQLRKDNLSLEPAPHVCDETKLLVSAWKHESNILAHIASFAYMNLTESKTLRLSQRRWPLPSSVCRHQATNLVAARDWPLIGRFLEPDVAAHALWF